MLLPALCALCRHMVMTKAMQCSQYIALQEVLETAVL